MNDSKTHATRYLAPGAFTRRVFNPLAARLTGLGLSLKGSRLLEVPGRSTGEIRTTVVNLLTVDEVQYLVAPRGTTQWVRNLRVAGGGSLRLGRRRQRFTAVELPDSAEEAKKEEEKVEVIRAYLAAWAWEVGQFFDGLTATSSDADIAAAAPGFPVFRIEVA